MTSRPVPRRARTALAALAVAGLALGATACGGDSASGSTNGSVPEKPSAAASGDAFAAGSAVDVATIKQMLSDAMESATTVHVDMTMTGRVQMSGSGDMDLSADPVKASLHLASSSLGGDITMLMVDEAMYLRSAMFGPKYVKVSTDDTSSPVSQMGLGSLDPAAMFDRLGDAVTAGTYVGKDSVEGTATDHYTFTVDPKALGGSSASTSGKETMDVWFDADGRYRKMAMEVGGESVTETFSDWDEPVEVAAPPADQVQDVTGLMNGRAGKTAP